MNQLFKKDKSELPIIHYPPSVQVKSLVYVCVRLHKSMCVHALCVMSAGVILYETIKNQVSLF